MTEPFSMSPAAVDARQRLAIGENHRLQEIIDNFSYKPNFTFLLETLNPSRIDGMHRLKMTVHTEDTYHPGSFIDVPVWFTFPMNWNEWTEEYALVYLRRCIEEFEQHEIDEWFRYKGKLVNDPHRRSPRG